MGRNGKNQETTVRNGEKQKREEMGGNGKQQEETGKKQEKWGK